MMTKRPGGGAAQFAGEREGERGGESSEKALRFLEAQSNSGEKKGKEEDEAEEEDEDGRRDRVQIGRAHV